MKRLLSVIVTAGLLLLPIAGYAGDDSQSASAPPISQALVREGDYAVKLVAALGVGSVEDETQAEDILAAAGVAPKSGWISDFPVTPDIIAEIQASIDSAADEGKLPLGKGDAENAFFALNSEIGLSITPAASDEQATEPAAPYSEPAVINNYYYDEGPPVVTYYAPPPDYLYLYAWDPFPFWCNGFFFPGFFVLSDFNFVFIDRDDFHHGHHDGHHDGHHHFVTNHVVDPISKKSVAIDPVARRPLAQTAFKPIGARGSFDPLSKTGGAHDRMVLGNVRGGSFDRTSATKLLGQSVNRPVSGTGSWSRDRAIAPATKTTGQWSRTGPATSRVTAPPSRSGGSGLRWSQTIPSGGSGRSTGDNLQGAPVVRSFNQPAYRGRSFSAPPSGGGRSVNAPSSGSWGRITEVGRSFGDVGGGRSVSSPSGGGGRSFSPSFGGSRSFSPSFGGSRSFSPSGGGRSFSAPAGGGGRSIGGGGGGRSVGGGGGFGGMRGR